MQKETLKIKQMENIWLLILLDQKGENYIKWYDCLYIF